ADLVDAHGAGRRRATIHARGSMVGFARARSHEIVDIEACPILVPDLNRALPVCRELERALRGRGKPLDILVTHTQAGIDLDLRGGGRVDGALRLRWGEIATEFDVARLSVHGDIVLERRAPVVRFGACDVVPPPGAFLQATEAADRCLGDLVCAGVAGARRVVDLFSGCGTFSLVLAGGARLTAVDAARPP